MQVISAELRSSKHWELTGEGTEIAEQGSQEARVFTSVPLEGLPQSELMVSSQNILLKYIPNMSSVSCCAIQIYVYKSFVRKTISLLT